MIADGSIWFSVVIYTVVAMLGVALVLSFLRVLIGPRPADRVVGLDLIASIVVGAIAVFAVASGDRVYLDVAIVLALIAFLGTIAFASYLVKGRLP